MERVIQLEICDRRGRLAQRVRLDRFPVTIGRAYSNDIVLDDRYVSPEHLTLREDGAGGYVVEDRASLNGLRIAGASERVPSLHFAREAELRIGRTVLRLRDADSPVPPALAERASRLRRFGHSRALLASLCAAGIGSILLKLYLETYSELEWLSFASGALAAALALLAWAGAWAFANRTVAHETRFFAHCAIASAALLAGNLAFTALEYEQFLFSPGRHHWIADQLVSYALAVGVIFAHLSLFSAMDAWRRFTSVAAACAAIFVTGAAVERATLEQFSNGITFDSVLKPLPERWLPAESIDEFFASAGALRDEVDALALEEAPTAELGADEAE
jgi:hypothetical protein